MFSCIIFFISTFFHCPSKSPLPGIKAGYAGELDTALVCVCVWALKCVCACLYAAAWLNSQWRCSWKGRKCSRATTIACMYIHTYVCVRILARVRVCVCGCRCECKCAGSVCVRVSRLNKSGTTSWTCERNGSAEKRKEKQTQVDIEIVQTENDLCAPFATQTHTHTHTYTCKHMYICTTVGRFIGKPPKQKKNNKTRENALVEFPDYQIPFIT